VNFEVISEKDFNVDRICKFCKEKMEGERCFNLAPRHEGVLGEWRYSSIHSNKKKVNIIKTI
jgi:hypothetical protein